MKSASVAEIKKELKHQSPDELIALCLRLARFKKENKELLTYLLYEKDDESAYIDSVKQEVNSLFGQINTKTYYFIKKGLRKILNAIKKYARYSGNKQTEVELHVYFLQSMAQYFPYFRDDSRLLNIWETQLRMLQKKIALLHEDLQFDYNDMIASI